MADVNLAKLADGTFVEAETEQGIIYRISPHNRDETLYVVESTLGKDKAAVIGWIGDELLRQGRGIVVEFGNGVLRTGNFVSAIVAGKGWEYRAF
jgi:hypothetical protein